jgi:hypothetical protein
LHTVDFNVIQYFKNVLSLTLLNARAEYWTEERLQRERPDVNLPMNAVPELNRVQGERSKGKYWGKGKGKGKDKKGSAGVY